MEDLSIYIVEDDENIRTMVLYALSGNGYQVTGFPDGRSFFQALEQSIPDMVLLDIMLPGEDGLTLLRRLRSRPDTEQMPVIMLTAKASEMDKVRGLDLGADDYISKPFGILELLSRVRALARRSVKSGRLSAGEKEDTLEYQSVCLKESSHVVTVSGQEIVLTRKEFQLLRDLLRHQGQALTRDQIMERVWGFAYGGATRTVDIHINTLRKKLGDDGTLIQTVRGIGYKIGK